MRVYVDSAIHRWRGQLWCHVFSPDIEALHRFMASIGSRREWFQDPSASAKVSWPHYDANERRRASAIAAGAIPLGRQQTVVMSRVVRNEWFGERTDPLSGHRLRGSPLLPRLEEWLEGEMRALRIKAPIHPRGIDMTDSPDPDGTRHERALADVVRERARIRRRTG